VATKSKSVVRRRAHVDVRTRAFCVELAQDTGNRPMHYRTVLPIARAAGLNDSALGIALSQAIEKGWLVSLGEPPHSAALTEAGRVMAARFLKVNGGARDTSPARMRRHEQ
jgi:hypothetical protein